METAGRRRLLTSWLFLRPIGLEGNQQARREWARVFLAPCNQLVEGSRVEAASIKCTTCQIRYPILNVIIGNQALIANSHIRNLSPSTHLDLQLTCQIRHRQGYHLALDSNQGVFLPTIMMFKVQSRATLLEQTISESIWAGI